LEMTRRALQLVSAVGEVAMFAESVHVDDDRRSPPHLPSGRRLT
jgi:hypothetical protein